MFKTNDGTIGVDEDSIRREKGRRDEATKWREKCVCFVEIWCNQGMKFVFGDGFMWLILKIILY